MNAFYYFPSAVYRDERPDLVEEILPVVNSQIDRSIQMDNCILQSGCLLSCIGDSVTEYILGSSTEILSDQGYVTDKYDFFISNLWYQEFFGSASTDVHVHSNSQISGWLFLDCEEGGVYPSFRDARTNKKMAELDFIRSEEITNATNCVIFNDIVPGTVIFANSWLEAQLMSGGGNSSTKCIHFIISCRDRL